MERISDLYQNPNDIENKQCTNPIYNSSENRLSVIEQSINSSLLENNRITHNKTFKIVFILLIFSILSIVSIVIYYVITGNKI